MISLFQGRWSSRKSMLIGSISKTSNTTPKHTITHLIFNLWLIQYLWPNTKSAQHAHFESLNLAFHTQLDSTHTTPNFNSHNPNWHTYTTSKLNHSFSFDTITCINQHIIIQFDSSFIVYNFSFLHHSSILSSKPQIKNVAKMELDS